MSKYENVLVAVKTPMSRKATTCQMPSHLTLAQAVTKIRETPPRDHQDERNLQLLTREVTGVHDYLAICNGKVVKVAPQTTISELAEPREIRTARGRELVASASFEVQAYAPVGS